MPLPETVRVKLSSEAAGSIAITPVVVQELTVRELLEQILGITGKDVARIREVLRRGTLVSGASRFRWTSWDADDESVRAALTAFPDADPSRPFASEHCVAVVLRSARGAIELPREAAARKGLFQRASCWDRLMELLTAAAPSYVGYSYRDRADLYMAALTPDGCARFHEAVGLLKYDSLRDRIRAQVLTAFDARVER
jgi:hypothetical protein